MTLQQKRHHAACAVRWGETQRTDACRQVHSACAASQDRCSRRGSPPYDSCIARSDHQRRQKKSRHGRAIGSMSAAVCPAHISHGDTTDHVSVGNTKVHSTVTTKQLIQHGGRGALARAPCTTGGLRLRESSLPCRLDDPTGCQVV